MWSMFRRKTRQTKPARRTPSSYRPHLEALEDRCLLSAPGALDPTFGSGGTVTTAITKANDLANGVLLQSNGDIIAYGGSDIKSGNSFSLARYTPSGSLDTTFGSGDIVTTSFGSSSDTIYQAVLQSDGKIVAAGGNHLVRYNSDGSLDTTFGSRGVVTYPSGVTAGGAVLIQPINGSEDIVAGAQTTVGNDTAIALLRYTPSGTLDPTFGTGGEVVTDIPGTNAYDNYLALENGGIVAGGVEFTSNGHLWLLARYTPSGSLDTTFGSGDIVTTSFGAGSGFVFPQIKSLLVQPNGQIVAVGDAVNSAGNFVWGLARYNVNGSLDNTFGSGGIVTSSITGFDAVFGSALQSNGEIVVAGWSGCNLYCLPVPRYETGPRHGFGRHPHQPGHRDVPGQRRDGHCAGDKRLCPGDDRHAALGLRDLAGFVLPAPVDGQLHRRRPPVCRFRRQRDGAGVDRGLLLLADLPATATIEQGTNNAVPGGLREACNRLFRSTC